MFSVILSLIITIITRPISIRSTLLLISFCSAIVLGLNSRSWFFYFLFLVFLGGVIVLVLFIVRISSRVIITYSPIRVSYLPLIVLLLSTTQTEIPNKSFSAVSINLNLYQIESTTTIIILIIILLVCLICVVNIRKLERGPLIKRL